MQVWWFARRILGYTLTNQRHEVVGFIVIYWSYSFENVKEKLVRESRTTSFCDVLVSKRANNYVYMIVHAAYQIQGIPFTACINP